jgi:hypothetical protein
MSESCQRGRCRFLQYEPISIQKERVEREIKSMRVAENSESRHEIKTTAQKQRVLPNGLLLSALANVILILSTHVLIAQASGPPSPSSTAAAEAPAGTSTDLFVMIGSDFDRPGLLPRANYNIGIGHTFGFLKKDPIGDELTFGYTYENAGTHGFLHTAFGEHTESAGVMKNFSLPKTKAITGYTWLQSGITSYTGNAHVQNRLDSGVSLGAIVHFNDNNSIWIQESYSKVVTVPWYTTTSIGYTYSW